MFISILCGGAVCGLGEADGVCIPGMFRCSGAGPTAGDGAEDAGGVGICISMCDEGEAVGAGDAPGICMPGMSIGIGCGVGVFTGEVDGFAAGVALFVAGTFMPGMLVIEFFLTGRRFRAVLLVVLGVVFRLAFGLACGIFIPGMFFMSWPWPREPAREL
jgi:hypothetical protein